jgi:hypothetical protein
VERQAFVGVGEVYSEEVLDLGDAGRGGVAVDA